MVDDGASVVAVGGAIHGIVGAKNGKVPVAARGWNSWSTTGAAFTAPKPACSTMADATHCGFLRRCVAHEPGVVEALLARSAPVPVLPATSNLVMSMLSNMPAAVPPGFVAPSNPASSAACHSGGMSMWPTTFGAGL